MALLGLAIVWTCLHRGPWYDEFYTQYVTRSDLPWPAAMRQSWLTDNHPPLYYMLARATDWLGPIEWHRFLNIGFAVAAIGGVIVIVRDVPRLAPATAILSLIVTANYATVYSASELRSYFLSLCAGTLLAMGLCAIAMEGHGGSKARRTVYALTSLVAFNTHIITSLSAASLIAPFLGAALARRNWQEAKALAAAPLIAGLLFVAVSLIQLPMWLANTKAFWITPGFEAARWSVEYAVLRTLEANPLVLLGALCGAAMLLRERLLQRIQNPELTAVVSLAAGIVLTAMVLVGIHMIRPILIEKYLTAMVGALTVGLAISCAVILRAAPARLGTCLLAAGLTISAYALSGNAVLTAARHSWFGTGRAIAAEVAKCPGTIVHTDPFWNADVMALLPADNAKVVPYGYRYVAARLGFTLAPDGSKAMSHTCPTLFWAEHDGGPRWTKNAVLVHLRSSGFPAKAIAFQTIGNGWIATAQPTR